MELSKHLRIYGAIKTWGACFQEILYPPVTNWVLRILMRCLSLALRELSSWEQGFFQGFSRFLAPNSMFFQGFFVPNSRYFHTYFSYKNLKIC